MKQVQVKWPQLKANSSKIIGLKTGYMNDRISSPPFLWNLFSPFLCTNFPHLTKKGPYLWLQPSENRCFCFNWGPDTIRSRGLGLDASARRCFDSVGQNLRKVFTSRFSWDQKFGSPSKHLHIFTSSRNSLLGIIITTFLKTKTCSEMERFFARFLDAFFVGLFLSIAKNPAGWRDGFCQWVALGMLLCHGTWAAQVRSAAFSPDGAPEGGSLSWNADGNYTTFSSNEIVRIMHHNRYH